MSNRVASLIGGFGRVLVGLGLLILAFAIFQLWGTGLAEQQAQQNLEDELNQQLALAESIEAENAASSEEAKPEMKALTPEQIPTEGDAYGKIRIPSVGVDKVFVEGVQRDTLRQGPGHYPDTPLPGQAGNAAIAGHRTTYGQPFHDLDKLNPGDEIFVDTVQGTFRYLVEPQPSNAGPSGWFAVKPTDTDVIGDTGDNRLTLTACHPKFSAAQRIVVTAVLDGEPAPTVDMPEEPEPPVLANADAELATIEAEIADTEMAMANAETEFNESLGWQPENAKPTIFWGLMSTGVLFAAWLVGKLWRARWSYLLASPIFLFLLFTTFTHLDHWIPAI